MSFIVALVWFIRWFRVRWLTLVSALARGLVADRGFQPGKPPAGVAFPVDSAPELAASAASARMRRIVVLTIRAHARRILLEIRAAEAIASAEEARTKMDRVRAFAAEARMRTDRVRAFPADVRTQAAGAIASAEEARTKKDRMRAFPGSARIRAGRIPAPMACMRIPPARVEKMAMRTRIAPERPDVEGVQAGAVFSDCNRTAHSECCYGPNFLLGLRLTWTTR